MRTALWILLACLGLSVSTGRNMAGEAEALAVSAASSPIRIDGILDEPAWADATVMPIPYEWYPGDNIPAPVKTDALITYDSRTFYIAFKAYDPDPSRIRAHIMDRDAVNTFVQDDHVLFMLDTFNDERRAFQFRVNPLGVQMDAIFSELDGIEDFSWDIIWESAGRITPEGYIVEVAIPLNQLRFQPGDGPQTWGIELGRSQPREVRHRMNSNIRDRNVNCVLCQFHKLTGFEGLEAGRNFELDPTLTFTRLEERDPFPTGGLQTTQEDADPGLTLRWGITPSLTLNATANPDFSQVEADVAQLADNERFALFFPEKRPFFLEGLDFFATPINTVFTRTVADPDWGLKFTGKQGKNAYGVFVTEDTRNNIILPSNQGSGFASSDSGLLDPNVDGAVLRYRRDVGKSHALGAIYTDREADGYHNRVGGVDGFFQASDKDRISFQFLRSDTEYPMALNTAFGFSDGPFQGNALEVNYQHGSRSWDWFAQYTGFDRDFRADFGFVPRADSRELEGQVTRKFWGGPDRWFRQSNIQLFATATENQEGERTDQLVQGAWFYSGPMQSSLWVGVSNSERLVDTIRYDNMNRIAVFGEIQPGGMVRFEFFLRDGDDVDFANNQAAEAFTFQPEMELKLGRRVNLNLRHTLRKLDVAGGELFLAELTEMRLFYHFNVRMFLRAIVQYNDTRRDPSLYTFPVEKKSESLFSQFLFSYKLNAKTVLFGGYSENRFGGETLPRTLNDRTVFVKLGYAWLL